jgi:hypothetical protein
MSDTLNEPCGCAAARRTENVPEPAAGQDRRRGLPVCLSAGRDRESYMQKSLIHQYR